MRSLDACGKMSTSEMTASSMAATKASPLDCEPETARAKRRRNGRCGAILVDNDMIGRLPQMTLHANAHAQQIARMRLQLAPENVRCRQKFLSAERKREPRVLARSRGEIRSF